MAACLTGLDVNGIQRYICESGKLREIIGASWLVDRFTRQRPLEILSGDMGLKEIAPAEVTTASGEWFVVIRAAGGVLRLLFPDRALGQRWARQLTEEMIREAPGLECSVAHHEFDWRTENLSEALGALVARLQAKRNRPRDGAGFPGVPISAPCQLTGRPAAGYGAGPNERLSRECLAKRAVAGKANQRQQRTLGQDLLEDPRIASQLPVHDADAIEFAMDFSDLASANGGDAGDNLMAIVCIDGNRLGLQVQALLRACQTNEARAAEYRAFSDKLDRAARAALRDALAESLAQYPESIQLRNGKAFLPARPLVQGGDDVTLVVAARLAFPLARAFGDSFRRHTKVETGLALEAGIGIAFTKLRAPFIRGYALAESLLASAKRKSRDSSCIDFEIIRQDSFTDIEELRERHYRARDGARLTRRPYFASDLAPLLEKAAFLGSPSMPRSQLKSAVDSCRIGVAKADEIYRNVRENMARGLGGRNGAPPSEAFARYYPDSFFRGEDNATDLLDCLDVFDIIGPAKR